MSSTRWQGADPDDMTAFLSFFRAELHAPASLVWSKVRIVLTVCVS